MRIGAFLFGAACPLGAAEAQAAAVCSNTPGANDRVSCQRYAGDGNDIDIDLTNPAIATSVDHEIGVHAGHRGTGGIDVDVAGGSISATGLRAPGVYIEQWGTGGASLVLRGGVEVIASAHGVAVEVVNTANGATLSVNVAGGSISTTDGAGVLARSSGTGGVDVDLAGVTVSTAGVGVDARHTGAGGTGVDIDVVGGSILTTGRRAYGVEGHVRTDSGGTASIDLTDVAVSTKGWNANGVDGLVRNVAGEALSISVTRGSVSTEGSRAAGIFGYVWRPASTAPISIKMTDVIVSTKGSSANGVYAIQGGAGALDVDLRGGSISTTGAFGYGVLVWSRGAGGFDIDLKDIDIATTTVETGASGAGAYGVMGYFTAAGEAEELSIDVTRGRIVTAGAFSYGIVGYSRHAESEATVSIGRTGGAIATAGANAYGVYALHEGVGGIDIDLADAAIATTGANAHGVYGLVNNSGNGSAISIDVAGGNIAAAGLGARGLFGEHRGLGSAAVRTRAAAEIEAPFAVGIEGRLTDDANAAGRILLTHEGAIKARETGVLARAARSSGHTFEGGGGQTADDASRAAPMIHVVSGGDIAVGAAATDAFIADRIAGADGTLSAGENAVLAAIAADDSAALDRALDALPAAYDDDYRTEARALLARRGHEASSASDLARLEAGRILGLSRAGVRALAISHTAIADHVRNGDRDPAILAIDEADRTEQQQATLAEQEKLSAGERKALEAVLTKGAGSELETALTALTGATYTTAWKNTVRQLAATYNAGDIQVDVRGGAIDAEGNGVEALYAVRHDSNGAIAVSVADGARVTGGAHGIHVRGAGAGTGGLRAQSVTVNGVVTGGGETGAGVHMADGGRLKVGKTGRVSATSGVGVLSDGAGNLHATVAGTCGGRRPDPGRRQALTLDVREGGAYHGNGARPRRSVDGRRAASAGLLYSSTAARSTVTPDRRAHRRRGRTARSKPSAAASGNLDLTVAGRVAGDLRAPRGGALRLNVQEGGTVAGTVYDPVGPLTVAGGIGRLLYSSGGAVTVTRTGALTGVKADGKTEAIRARRAIWTSPWRGGLRAICARRAAAC